MGISCFVASLNNRGAYEPGYIYFHGEAAPNNPGSSHYQGSTIILRHITFSRTPLDELSVRPRDPYLTHNTHKRETSMTPAGFELIILVRNINKKVMMAQTETSTTWNVNYCFDAFITGFYKILTQ
jgi:hypothetical protein